MKKRSTSFALIGAVYLFAIAVGVAFYIFLPFHFAVNLLIADILSTVFVFIFSVAFSNASVYDPYWSVQPPVIVTAFALGKVITFGRLLILVAIWLWGIRLTVNWAYTFHGLEHQDWRYTMLRERTGAFYPLVNFIGIHMVPTLVVYACTLPAVYMLVYDMGWNIGSLIFFCISILAVSLQGVADAQMHRFRKHRDSVFIRTGLWKNSRHPNYLGEILMWWSVALSLVSVSPSHWYLMCGAALNTALFMFVSIPMADNRQARKAGFEEYKKETRMLLPIGKRS